MDITGTKLTTIEASSGTTYNVKYQGGSTVDIVNGTEGDIVCGYSESLDGTDVLTIPEGGCYNGLRLNGSVLYLKPQSDGYISIVRL